MRFAEQPPRFRPWQTVAHITEPSRRGIVTAFMQRGANISYEVQWAIDKCVWHLDAELMDPEQLPSIGYPTEPESATPHHAQYRLSSDSGSTDRGSTRPGEDAGA